MKSLMYLCSYQKDYEQRRKKGITLDEASIINRYELRTRHEKAQELARKLIKTDNFEPIIFGLINYAIIFYDRRLKNHRLKSIKTGKILSTTMRKFYLA